MYLRLGLNVQIGPYYVLTYKAKILAQHRIGFRLDQCIMYFGLSMPNLQKIRLLIFKIFNIKKCTLFLEPSIFTRWITDFHRERTLTVAIQGKYSQPTEVCVGYCKAQSLGPYCLLVGCRDGNG